MKEIGLDCVETETGGLLPLDKVRHTRVIHPDRMLAAPLEKLVSQVISIRKCIMNHHLKNKCTRCVDIN